MVRIISTLWSFENQIRHMTQQPAATPGKDDEEGGHKFTVRAAAGRRKGRGVGSGGQKGPPPSTVSGEIIVVLRYLCSRVILGFLLVLSFQGTRRAQEVACSGDDRVLAQIEPDSFHEALPPANDCAYTPDQTTSRVAPPTKKIGGKITALADATSYTTRQNRATAISTKTPPAN